MIAHTTAVLALRTQLLTLSVATTGSITMAATTTGYTRTTGSFLTDGFAVGMELTPSGFSTTTRDVITAVSALAITTRNTHTAQAASAGRTLTVGVPNVRVWENTEPVDATGAAVAIDPSAPYFSEQYVPGPTQRITLGALGELEALPLYLPRVFVPQATGRAAASRYADALVALFAPSTSLTISNATLQVRGDTGPFPGPLVQAEQGFAAIPVTIPLRYRSPNLI